MNYVPVHDRLASEYVLGTLHGRARARFEQLMHDEPALQSRVAFWEAALTPMALSLSSAPSSRVWSAIAARVAPRAPQRQPGWAQRWFSLRTLASLAAGLFVGVATTVFVPVLLDPDSSKQAQTQLPESYVGVLAAADGRAGLIVSSLRHGKVMDLKQVQPVAVAAGRTLFLWVIEADGQTRPIGPVPSGRFVQVALPRSSEQLFGKASELAVSIEASGAVPVAPFGPFVYRGLCGKLWRAPPPKNG